MSASSDGGGLAPDLRLVPPGGHDLPPPRTSFVGRTEERTTLERLLSTSPLVTVVGAPGVGKSRLAREVARESADRDALLLLDDCDHAGPMLATVVDRLLRRAAERRILATAREPLGAAGEQLLAVEPLGVDDAVRLFCDRAGARGRGFMLTPTNTADVHELCRRLDGLPLAIELAAGWAGVLSPRDILDRLDDGFDLLNRGEAGSPARHQSLRRSLAWSYDGLSPSEGALLRRLSVFAGGWTLAAAEQVCGAGDLAPNEVAKLLARLADKSLVTVDASDAETRYGLLRTVRSFADRELALAEEAEWVRDRHARWSLSLLEEAEPAMRSARRQQAFARLGADHENLTGGLEWMLASGRQEWALRAVAVMGRVWRERRQSEEGEAFVARALALAEGPSQLRGRALFELGYLVSERGRYAAALAHLEEALRVASAFGDIATVARSLVASGMYRVLLGDAATAVVLVERGLDVARRTQDRGWVVTSLGTAGNVSMFVGDARRAQDRFTEALAVAAETGDSDIAWTSLVGAGWAAYVLGAYDEAQARFEEALAIGRTTVFESAAGVASAFLGELARARGRYGEADALLSEALAQARDGGSPFPLAIRLAFMGRLRWAEGNPEPAVALFAESLALARRARLPLALGQSLLGMGMARLALADPAGARTLVEEALATTRTSGDRRTSAAAMVELARLDHRRGADEPALSALLRALETYDEIGDVVGTLEALELLAAVRAAQGRYPAAARVFGAADAARRAIGSVPPPALEAERREVIDAAVSDAGLEAWSQAWAEGAARSVGEAVAYATSRRGPRSRSVKGWAALTRTERLVVGLVTQGLTNREIASRLLVSTRTVESHVSHVLAKLGLASRRDVAREAARRLPTG
ncbi:MAG TPA: LuxR C-terminal-related transcriptional regulator [Acidimicrobiales bacterium]|nr:LuxR C-terminal-related transcriptional regulator [Acidimicrobiales bacterium]